MGKTEKTALAVIEEYINEMIAEGAWCRHAYAAEYLKDLQVRVRTLLAEISETSWGKARKYDLERTMIEIKPDFDGYISEVYSAGISHREQIAEFVDDAFKKALEHAIGWIKEFVKDSAIEEMSSMGFDPGSMKYLGKEEYKATAIYNGERYSISLVPYDKDIAGGDWRKAAAIRILAKLDPRYEQYIFC